MKIKSPRRVLVYNILPASAEQLKSSITMSSIPARSDSAAQVVRCPGRGRGPGRTFEDLGGHPRRTAFVVCHMGLDVTGRPEVTDLQDCPSGHKQQAARDGEGDTTTQGHRDVCQSNKLKKRQRQAWGHRQRCDAQQKHCSASKSCSHVAKSVYHHAAPGRRI